MSRRVGLGVVVLVKKNYHSCFSQNDLLFFLGFKEEIEVRRGVTMIDKQHDDAESCLLLLLATY